MHIDLVIAVTWLAHADKQLALQRYSECLTRMDYG
jgi:hypothetical protein